MDGTAQVPPAYLLTSSEWLKLPEQAGLQEILEGELLVTPSPSTRHQTVSAAVFASLWNHLHPRRLGRVFAAPTGVHLSEHTVLEPDVLVVLAANTARIAEQWIDGAPDLVVEVLSPGSAGRDLIAKRAVYERAGVPEYWIVDPKAATIEVLALRAGRFTRHGLFAAGGSFSSALLPDLQLDLEAVFA